MESGTDDDNVPKKSISVKINETYDPRKLGTRVIRSELITKGRLTTRNENIEKYIAEPEMESDEIFFEKLKKRMHQDRFKTVADGIEKSSSKRRSSLPRKKKKLFDDESLKLMQNFRTEFASRILQTTNENKAAMPLTANDESPKKLKDHYSLNFAEEMSKLIEFETDDQTHMSPIPSQDAINEILSNTIVVTPNSVNYDFENFGSPDSYFSASSNE